MIRKKGWSTHGIITILICLLILADIVISTVYLSEKYKLCKADTVASEYKNYHAMTDDNIEDMLIALDTLAACFETSEQWSEEQTVEAMKSTQLRHGFDFVVKTEADGYAVNMDGKTQIYLGDRAYFLAGMQGKSTTSFIHQGRVDASKSFILSAVPVMRNGKVVGIVHGSYAADHYFSNICQVSDMTDEWVMLIDSDGTIVASLNNKGAGTNIAEYDIRWKNENQVESAVNQNGSGTFYCSMDAENYIAYYSSADFYGSDLSLVLAMREDKVLVDTNLFLHSILPFIMINGAILVSILLYLIYQTNRKRSQREFERLNAMISNIPTGIMVYESGKGDIIVRECSSICLQMFGVSRDRIIGAKKEQLLGLVHPDDRSLAERMMYELSNPDVTRTFDLRKHTEDGYIWLRASAHSTVRRDNSVYIYISYTDITEEKQAEALKLELEIAKAANEAKMEFLSTMSHDLRTPLNTVINMTTLAYDDLRDEQRLRDDLSKIEVAGSFMLGLIKDVLDVSRIESGKLTLSPQVYHFDEFENYINGIIAPLCQSKDIRLVLDFRISHKTVLVDPIRFNQVFFNILSNAVKYSNEGTEIQFQIEELAQAQDTTHVRFIIRDQGIGMSEAFMQKLFQPFERENTSDAFLGTGLGMYISKQIVTSMNGTIDVQSRPNAGTTVTILLPLTIGAELPPADHSTTDASNQPQVSGKILVVEDHPLNREIVIRLLERKGYCVDAVEDGLQALNKMEACPDGEYHAILMDIRMPVMDGLTATARIRALPREYTRHIPIIAMSANAFEEDKKKSLEAGMDAHLAKPVVPDELYNMTKAFILCWPGFHRALIWCYGCQNRSFPDDALQVQLIPAYCIVWRNTQKDHNSCLWLKPAQSADDAGVIVSFHSEAVWMTESLSVPGDVKTYPFHP